MAERLAIVDYGAGNLRSVAKALETVARDMGRELQVIVTASADTIAAADRIVLPGVGAFGQCAAALRALPGMEAALERRVIEEGTPFLGVCVGMQLLARRGSEHGSHRGLGWIPGEVVRLAPSDLLLKVPHMAWSPVRLTAEGAAHPALSKLDDGGQAYFVHSYHFVPADGTQLLGTCDYGGEVAAIIGGGNILGVQFHPEKSQAYGLAFLRHFLEWRP
ncbi:imidazole glycerol phosphate synthase subunit HisH [Sphingoaurantiacus capsulatus]|uniref:Imidazole glycerol phosphate synthase subunit HisH n=1 Tax=Sphingoaurantiacus capsulatus TaxID=1771310 RepID=A0ABV7XI20_9SPHN